MQGAVALLTTYALVAIRTGAALRLIPFFGGSPMPVLPWLALSAAVALALTPIAAATGDPAPGGLAWLALAVKELFVGVAIGILVRLAFSVLEVAAGLVRIFSDSGRTESRDTPSAPLSVAYVLLAAAAFLLVGGHHGLISGLAGTFRCLPPGSLQAPFETFGPSVAIGLFASAMGLAVLVSIPLLFAGAFAETFMGVVSRVAGNRGGRALRVALVELAAIAILGTLVSGALGFLETALHSLDICSPV